MSKGDVKALEERLKKLREKEALLREELDAKKKAADIRYRKELTKKKCDFAEIFTTKFGDSILENPNAIAFFVSEHILELSSICNGIGYQE